MSSPLHCSFCGKTEHQVAKLAAGPDVYICDECVAAASRIMREADSPRPVSRWGRLLSHGRRWLPFRGKAFLGIPAARHAA